MCWYQLVYFGVCRLTPPNLKLFPAYGTHLTCTTPIRTLKNLTAAFSTVRPSVERSRASKGISNPAMDLNAKSHDFTVFKSLLDSITNLVAQIRLLGIIRNRKRLVDALFRGDSRRSHPVPPPSHHQAAHQHGAASHTHRTRTTRAPESTTIT